jgi:hypothetical protein
MVLGTLGVAGGVAGSYELYKIEFWKPVGYEAKTIRSALKSQCATAGANLRRLGYGNQFQIGSGASLLFAVF